MGTRPRIRKTTTRRRAAATVEMAICLPLLFLVVFGGIEAASAVYMKQVATTAAYEGSRTAAAMGGKKSDAKKRIRQVMKARSIKDFTIAFEPNNINSVDRGERITATVTVPMSNNMISVTQLFSDTNVSSSVSMVRQ